MINRICIILFILISVVEVLGQPGNYYNSISTSYPAFVDSLKKRIRDPYTKVAYDLFDETNITNFAAISNPNGSKSVFCVYSNYEHNYTGTFSWIPLDREHTFAHSWQPTYPSTSGNEYADQHHLFPTHANNANSIRGNNPLGNVVTPDYTFLESKRGTDINGNLVYEPKNSHKGDAARALLYMAVRYDGIGGNSWTFNWLNSTRLPGIGVDTQSVATLIAWHKQDPPDKWEVDRNNYVQSIQQNRNPFVDHPEWVNYINFYNLNKTNPTYAIEPTNYVTNFSATTSSNSITVNWTDAAAGSQVPSGYLLLAYSKDNYFIPIDGSTYTDDTNLSDGVAAVNISYSSPDSYTFNNLNPNSTYYFTIYSYNGTGTQINYKIDSTVPRTNAAVSGSLAAEPTNHVTNFASGTITQTSVQLIWTDAVLETQLPEGYIILANNTGNFTAPSDGIVYSDDTVLVDGSAKVNVLYSAANTFTFSGLNSGMPYYFRIYSYNGSGSLRNYKTDGTVPSTSATTNPSSGSLPNAWVNEIHYDNSGTDVNEFVEIVLPNNYTTSTELAKFSVVLYNGSGGTVYSTTLLSAFIKGVVDSAHGFTFYSFVYPVDGLQNGAPDGIALGYDGNLIQFLSYEGTFTGVGGIANGVLSTDIGVSETGTTPVASSLGLTGSGRKYSDFNWTTFSSATRGNNNSGQALLGFTLNLTAIIEGFFEGTTMISDTAIIQLRTSTSPYNLVEEKKAVLNSTGNASANFVQVTEAASYYIVVKHRNSIQTWSANGQSFIGGTLSFNFATAQNKAYGSNLKNINGKWCIFSGDVNQDGIVDLSDLSLVAVDSFNFTTGYVVTDVNGDGIVDLSDLALVDNNSLLIISQIIPQ